MAEVDNYEDYEYGALTIRGLLKQYLHNYMQRIKYFLRHIHYKLLTPKRKEYFDKKYAQQIFEWTNRQSAIYSMLPKQPWKERINNVEKNSNA